MPDFSKPPAGWAVGAHVSDLALQLTVLEEWGDSEVCPSPITAGSMLIPRHIAYYWSQAQCSFDDDHL